MRHVFVGVRDDRADRLLRQSGHLHLHRSGNGTYDFAVRGADGGSIGGYHGGAGGYVFSAAPFSKGEQATIIVGGYIPGVNGANAAYDGGASYVTINANSYVGGYGGRGGADGSGSFKFPGNGGYFGVNGVFTLITGAYGATGGGNGSNGSVDVYAASGSAPVPEPSSWSLLLSGFGFLGYVLRRRVARFA